MASPIAGGSEDSESVNELPSSTNSPRHGRLIVISGPSGVGKSTVVHALQERIPFHFSVSATTRRRRPGETDGVDYWFVTPDQFDEMQASNELLEWAEYGGNRYGTPRGPVEEQIRTGDHVVLDIENLGAMQVKEAFPEALTVFLAPPSRDELERRLRSRADTDEHDIRLRLEVADWQEAMARERFDHVVVNGDLDEVLATIVRIIEHPIQQEL